MMHQDITLEINLWPLKIKVHNLKILNRKIIMNRLDCLRGFFVVP